MLKFSKWLLNEMRHFVLDDNPIYLEVDGSKKKVTGIDFKWEDFGEQKLATKYFVQEFPHGVGHPGQVFINAGYWDGYWIEDLNPSDLQKLRNSNKVLADTEFKQIMINNVIPSSTNKVPVNLEINPLDKFDRIDPKTIPDLILRSPYDKKTILSWWDFVELLDGQNVVKHACRVR